jgi:hypothetical protein
MHTDFIKIIEFINLADFVGIVDFIVVRINKRTILGLSGEWFSVPISCNLYDF